MLKNGEMGLGLQREWGGGVWGAQDLYTYNRWFFIYMVITQRTRFPPGWWCCKFSLSTSLMSNYLWQNRIERFLILKQLMNINCNNFGKYLIYWTEFYVNNYKIDPNNKWCSVTPGLVHGPHQDLENDKLVTNIVKKLRSLAKVTNYSEQLSQIWKANQNSECICLWFN